MAQRVYRRSLSALRAIRGAVLVIALAGTGTAWAAPTPEPSFFNSTEIQYDGLKPFPKWTGALDKYFKEKAKLESGCGSNRCPFTDWLSFLESIKGDAPATQLNKVNRFMNKRRYINDPINWGVKDYWASPNEFFSKNGDCEDYSISKYISLKALGWSDDALRIVVLQDLNLRLGHAVLVVNLDGKHLLLDNQQSSVIETRRVRHYLPIYSVNETHWWRHRAIK
ncbi:MAG: transglutaminase-like cysteine peptidase [Magnetospiraceae bacterium]